MRLRRLMLLGALAASLGLAACSGGDDGSDGGAAASATASVASSAVGGASGAAGASSTAASSSKVLNPCDLLTQADAASALGEPVNAGQYTDSKNPLGQQLCFFSTVAESTHLVQLSLIQTAGLSEGLRNGAYGNARAQYDLNEAARTDKEDVTGVGDDAFYSARQLYAVKGDVYISVTVSKADGAKDAAVTIAKQVLARVK